MIILDAAALALLLALALFLGICTGIPVGRWLELEQRQIDEEDHRD